MSDTPADAVPAGGFRRIAVLRLSSLGDVILTLPAVHALRRAWPDARITFWVKEEYAGVVRHDPALDHVRVLERDARRIEDLVSMSAELEDHDLIVDLHGNSRTRILAFRQKARVVRTRSWRMARARWVHARWTRPAPLPSVLERHAATLVPLGVTVSGVPRVTVPAADEDGARTTLAALGSERPCVALAPGALHATKRWPEDRWCALDERLEAMGLARVVLSTAAERRGMPRLAKRIEGAGSATWLTGSLERAAAALGLCRVAVTHDSGLMHLAAARGVPVVAIFGSTSPVLGFAPAGEGHSLVQADLPCRPCTLHGRERCPLGHFRCMNDLSPETVLEQVTRSLARR